MAITLAASLVAILLLAGAARLLRLGHDARIDRDEAIAAAEGALPGFEASDVVVASDGGGALALGADGRLALVKRHGARAAVRAVDWPAVRQTAAGVEVETGERQFGRVTLADVDALVLRRMVGVRRPDKPHLTRHPREGGGPGATARPSYPPPAATVPPPSRQ